MALDSNKLLEDWKLRIDKSATQYQSDMENKKWKIDDNSHFFFERLSSFFQVYNEQIPQELMADSNFRKEIMQAMFEKVHELNIPIRDDRMLAMMNFYPESIKHIDSLDKRYAKDEVIIKAVKKNPTIMDFLQEEQIDAIAKSYESDLKRFGEQLEEDPYICEDIVKSHSDKYANNEPNFIMQLIKTNPEVLQSERIQTLIKDNPELEKEVTIFTLSQRKMELESQIIAADEEIERFADLDLQGPEKE